MCKKLKVQMVLKRPVKSNVQGMKFFQSHRVAEFQGLS